MPTAARASRKDVAQVGEPLPPKRGYIRVLCVKAYKHGHMPAMTKKALDELEIDPTAFRAGVTEYVPGEQYYLPSMQAARFLRDLGPARFRNPITEKLERRREDQVFFRVVDRDELDDFLDELVEAEEQRLEGSGEGMVEHDVNDAGVDVEVPA